MSPQEQLFQFIESSKSNMINLEKQLCAIPALSPDNGGEGEWDKAEFLIDFLKKNGIEKIERYDAPDARAKNGMRPNIVATIDGVNDSSCFWIMTHLDIVPPGDAVLWENDPYQAVEKDGKLYGRGVEDNQQGMVASIYAALGFVKNNIVPKRTIKLLFVADEETASDFGIKYLLKEFDLFGKDDIILVPDGGNKEGTSIEVAEKSVLWLKFSTEGKQCHASTPEAGVNSFLAGSDLVMRLYELNNVFGKTNELFDPPGSTFTPTKKEANVPNINTIPGEDVFYLDCRILPSISLDKVFHTIDKEIAAVQEKYGVTISYETIQRVVSKPTPEDSPIVGSLKSAVNEVYQADAKPMGIGGGTVGAYLRNAGFDTVVWAKMDETMHMPNEYTVIENLVGDAKVMAYIGING
ncbi:MAG: M20 family metallo-hydrolase [Spirochaetia bacterium]